MNKLVLRTVGGVATAALVATMGASVPAQAAPIPAVAGTDPLPAALGAAYLAAQPGADGIINLYGSKQYGVTIDAAWSLDAVGGQPAALAAMTQGIRTEAGTYATTAGAVAKVTAFLLSQGQAGSDVSALVAQLEGRVDTASPTNDPDYGRLLQQGDANAPSVIDQALADRALSQAGSGKAAPALDFLLKQQCTGTVNGFFRANPSAPDAAGATNCNNAAAADRVPDVDTTALAVLALQGQKGVNADVAQRVNLAVSWLVSQQAADGSFGGAFGPNANTTGLAGWVLGISNRPNAAARSAQWLRGHQLVNAGACAPYAAQDNGVVTYDDGNLGQANGGTFDSGQRDLATFATAQALPALFFADGGPAAGDTKLTVPSGYVPAATTQTVTVKGAPGNVLCFTNGASSSRVVVDAAGNLALPVALPAAGGPFSVSTVDGGGESDVASFSSLAATKLTVKVKGGKAFVKRNATVKVKGLAPGEQVTLKFRGVQVAKGTANSLGKFKTKFKTRKIVKGNVKAIGAFGDRKGKDRLVVVKRPKKK